MDVEDINASRVAMDFNNISLSFRNELLHIISKKNANLIKDESEVLEIKTLHSIYDANNERIKYTKFSLDKESKGTQKLYSLAEPIIETIKNGGILFIDEFDTNLHPEDYSI